MRHILLSALVSCVFIAQGTEHQHSDVVHLQFLNAVTGKDIADLPLLEIFLDKFPEQQNLPRSGENNNIIRAPVGPELQEGVKLLAKTLNEVALPSYDMGSYTLEQLSTLTKTTRALKADSIANELLVNHFIPKINNDGFAHYYIQLKKPDTFDFWGLNQADLVTILSALRAANDTELQQKTGLDRAGMLDLEYQKMADFKTTSKNSSAEIVFYPDEKHIFFNTKNAIEALKITPADTGDTVQSLGEIVQEKPDSTITHFSLNHNGDTLGYVTMNAEGSVDLVIAKNSEKGYRPQQTIPVGKDWNDIEALAFHPTKNTLLVALSKQIMVFEEEGQQYVTTQIIEQPINSLAWHPKKDTFAAGGHNTSVFTKDAGQYQIKQSIPDIGIANLAFSSNPDSIIGLRDQFVFFRDADQQGNYQPSKTSALAVNDLARGNKPSIAIHPHQTRSFILGNGPKILAYAPGVNKDEVYKIHEFPSNGESNTNASVAFSSTGKYFAAITSEGDGLVGKYHTITNALDALKNDSTIPQALLIAAALRYRGLNVGHYPPLVPVYNSLNQGALKGRGIQEALAPLLYYKQTTPTQAQQEGTVEAMKKSSDQVKKENNDQPKSW